MKYRFNHDLIYLNFRIDKLLKPNILFKLVSIRFNNETKYGLIIPKEQLLKKSRFGFIILKTCLNLYLYILIAKHIHFQIIELYDLLIILNTY